MINWFCHMYPYGNLHELNLDWVIDTVKRGEKEIADFIGVNTIKYANPILWNIESQYEANTVVVDGQTGNAYISVKAVPSGVHLNREEYWTQIYNYANVIDTLREQIAYNEGESTTATRPYSVNDLVFVNGDLYRVIHSMIAGDSFVVDSNVVDTTINEELDRLREDIDDEASARESADTQLQANIDANSDKIGTLSDLSTDDKSDLVHAINEVDAHADANQTRIGHLPDLSTNDKSDLVHAINEVNSKSLMSLKGKKILIIGDSISATDNTLEGVQPVWSTQFANKLSNVCEKITNISFSGARFSDMVTYLNLLQDYDYDIAIFFLGTNDAFNSPVAELGNFGTDYTKFSDCVRQTFEIVNNNVLASTGHRCEIYYITPLWRDSNVNSIGLPLWFYNSVITGFCKRWGAKWINGFGFPGASEYYSNYFVDGLHPTTEYASIMCDYIINKLCSGGDSSSYNNDSMIVSLETYLDEGVTGTFKGFIENERLHLKGQLRLTPTSTNQRFACGLTRFLSQVLFSLPYVECSTFGATNGNIGGLVYTDGSGNMLVNCNWTTLESTRVDFDYIVQPVWNNIARNI